MSLEENVNPKISTKTQRRRTSEILQVWFQTTQGSKYRNKASLFCLFPSVYKSFICTIL